MGKGFNPEGEAIQPALGDNHTRALWLAELTSAVAPWPWLLSIRVTEGAIPRQTPMPLPRTWGIDGTKPEITPAPTPVPLRATLVIRGEPFGSIERVAAGWSIVTPEGTMIFGTAEGMAAWLLQRHDTQ